MPATVARTQGASLLDLGDGVLCLAFHSKGNTLDGDTLRMTDEAARIIPSGYAGLVIGNDGKHFSFGANLRWLLQMLDDVRGDRSAFRAAAKRFQGITTGLRTLPFPVVCAPFELTIGGALEMTMYADAVVAHAGMRASLPEVAVGILPDLGGTSELYARCVEAAGEGNEPAGLRAAFETIVLMRASQSAEDARRLHFLRASDTIWSDRATLVDAAKARVLELAPRYRPPAMRENIPVLGDPAYRALEAQVHAAVETGRATPYDATIACAVARVMTASPGPARSVSHAELLDAETEAFETLVFRPETRARMEHMLAHGTPLRN